MSLLALPFYPFAAFLLYRFAFGAFFAVFARTFTPSGFINLIVAALFAAFALIR